MEAFQQLMNYYRELTHFRNIYSLLVWDQNINMPPLQVKDRGEQIGLIYGLLHQKMTSPDLVHLLEASMKEVAGLPGNAYEVRMVNRAISDYERANKVPAPFMAKIAQQAAETYQTWIHAKSSNNFNKIVDPLERMIEYSREFAECFNDSEHILNPLLDMNEPGLKVSYLQEIFQNLRKQLIPLIRELVERQKEIPYPELPKVPAEDQVVVIEWLIQQLGYSFQSGRLDRSAHPFMVRLGSHDVRITTRFEEDDFTESIFSSIHETGHALYELGLNSEYIGTPFEQLSGSIHESQSRLWENLIGRSRPFWEFAYPELQKRLPQVAHLSLNDFLLWINRVQPGFIRTKADEVTYNLHVLIRFETESDLLTGRLAVKDLPEYWADQYEATLGVRPSHLEEGVLQDMHWFSGLVGGCFQNYALGNLISCQLLEKIEQSYPKLWEDIASGQFLPLRSWLKENIHQYGSYYEMHELVQKVTGKELSVDPFIRYLTKKYDQLYSNIA